MSGFGQREQGVRRAALDENIRTDMGEAASRIEYSAKHEVRREEKQGMRRQTADLDAGSLAQAEAWVAGRQQIDLLQGDAAEALIVGAKDRSQVLSEVNLAAFQHRHRVAAGGL